MAAPAWPSSGPRPSNPSYTHAPYRARDRNVHVRLHTLSMKDNYNIIAKLNVRLGSYRSLTLYELNPRHCHKTTPFYIQRSPS